jgi:hypothetical protein
VERIVLLITLKLLLYQQSRLQPADLCIDAGIQSGLGSGTATGGVYSGTGVTDDGNRNLFL